MKHAIQRELKSVYVFEFRRLTEYAHNHRTHINVNVFLPSEPLSLSFNNFFKSFDATLNERKMHTNAIRFGVSCFRVWMD